MSEIAPIGFERLPLLVNPIQVLRIERVVPMPAPIGPPQINPVTPTSNRQKTDQEVSVEQSFKLTPETLQTLIDLQANES
ncbi:MAG: hypothetical protein QF654_09475 [Alphaproteobacteria bacterium]|jgi:hypothetical protein|nr:hypothetical protein [Alphaproteobacteria bacterium]MDP6603637.1 hypothetical protein [Rhodospirillales bacterium]|tara:strand:- start:439 stop:678 length:240 start_codon:yes stop_codon:yes gene_type:complete